MRIAGLKQTAILFAASALLVTTPAIAKCKFSVDTKHSRTGERVLWTKWNTFKLVLSDHNLVGSGLAIGNQKYFALRFTRGVSGTKSEKDRAFIIPAESKLMLLLDDKTKLELYSESEVIGDVYGGYAEAVVRFPADASTLDALIKKRIMNMRLMTPTGQFDWAFGKKGSKKLQETLACI